MRKLAINSAIVLGITAAAVITWRMRGALVLLLLSIAVAGAARPPAEALMRRGMSRLRSLAVIYVLSLAALGALAALLAPPIVTELPVAADRLISAYQALRHTASVALPAWPELMLQALFATRSLFEVLSSILVTLVLGFYWAARPDPIETLMGLLADPLRADVLRMAWRDLRTIAGGHLASSLLRITLAAPLVALELRILELPFWALGAFAAAVVGVMPFIGLPLALVIGVLVGLSEGAIVAGAAAAPTGAAVVLVEHCSQRLLQVNVGGPIMLVACALAMLHALGVAGLLVAAPLAAMLTYLFHLILKRQTAWHFATRGTLAPGVPGAALTEHGIPR